MVLTILQICQFHPDHYYFLLTLLYEWAKTQWTGTTSPYDWELRLGPVQNEKVYFKCLQAVKSGSIESDFRGLAMGDSWISPVDSILTWGPYLYATVSATYWWWLYSVISYVLKAKRTTLQSVDRVTWFKVSIKSRDPKCQSSHVILIIGEDKKR